MGIMGQWELGTSVMCFITDSTDSAGRYFSTFLAGVDFVWVPPATQNIMTYHCGWGGRMFPKDLFFAAGQWTDPVDPGDAAVLHLAFAEVLIDSIEDHFVCDVSLIMTICQLLVGVSKMGVPQIIQVSIDMYRLYRQ